MATRDRAVDNGSMIEYRTDSANIRPEMINGLFVGWPTPPTSQRLIEVMDASYRRVWALDGDRVVGYINAISDGIYNSFIPWLEVHPDYQEQGIGGELVRRIVADLSHLYSIDLCCAPQLIPYYEKLGFTGIAGAAIRNRHALASD